MENDYNLITIGSAVPLSNDLLRQIVMSAWEDYLNDGKPFEVQEIGDNRQEQFKAFLETEAQAFDKQIEITSDPVNHLVRFRFLEDA